MSSMEMIIGEPSRLERLAVDIHNHYISSCATNPDRIQKAMIVCSNRKIAYSLLKKFKEKYQSPEVFTLFNGELHVMKMPPQEQKEQKESRKKDAQEKNPAKGKKKNRSEEARLKIFL